MTDTITATTTEPGKLDIGRVISGTFSVIGRNFVTFAVLSLVLAGIPTALIAFIQVASLRSAEVASFDVGYLSSLGYMGLATMITGAVLQGALVYGTVQDMSGARASIAECLASGLRAFLPLIGLSILLAVAISFGLLLLIVPGVMMACAWCVAVPALVADRSGVFGAFSRSAELTRGNRWRIFALFIVVMVIVIVVGAVIGGVSMAFAFAGGGLDPVALARSPVQIVSNLISNTITSMISSAGVAVLYVELRRAREGLGPQWLSEIFS